MLKNDPTKNRQRMTSRQPIRGFPTGAALASISPMVCHLLFVDRVCREEEARNKHLDKSDLKIILKLYLGPLA
jgi:hypothetical protein